MLNGSMSLLKSNLDTLRPADRMMLIPLAKEYSAASLACKGINALAHHHRAKLEAIKASVGDEWQVLITTANLNHTRKVGRRQCGAL